jgi:hypothetical protein
MNELRAQVAQAVKAKRMRKANTRTNQKFLKMSRKQLENFLEQERRRKLGASITGFAVSAEESDKEKANRKRERLLKTRPQNLKKAAEEETALRTHRRDAGILQLQLRVVVLTPMFLYCFLSFSNCTSAIRHESQLVVDAPLEVSGLLRQARGVTSGLQRCQRIPEVRDRRRVGARLPRLLE